MSKRAQIGFGWFSWTPKAQIQERQLMELRVATEICATVMPLMRVPIVVRFVYLSLSLALKSCVSVYEVLEVRVSGIVTVILYIGQ